MLCRQRPNECELLLEMRIGGCVAKGRWLIRKGRWSRLLLARNDSLDVGFHDRPDGLHMLFNRGAYGSKHLRQMRIGLAS